MLVCVGLFFVFSSQSFHDPSKALEFLERLFDIEPEFIIGSQVNKFNIRPEAHDKGVEFRAPQAGEFHNKRAAEPMINELFFLFAQQSFLESQHTAVAAEAEHIEKFAEIEPHGPTRIDGRADTGFIEVECFGIILPVLDRIHPVIARFHHHLFQFCNLHVQGDIETEYIGNGTHGVFGCWPAQVGEPDRIRFVYRNGVPAGGIGDGARTGIAQHTDGRHRILLRHIVYTARNVDPRLGNGLKCTC